MALFGKKKEQPTASCCDGCVGSTPQNMKKAESEKAEGAAVKILGSGCSKCNALEAATRAALEQLGMDTAIKHRVEEFIRVFSVVPAVNETVEGIK